MWGAPQSGFSRLSIRINWRTSFGTAGRPGLPWRIFHLQNRPKPFRCQPITVAALIAQGPLPVGEALKVALQITEALEYAHERGIVHRDLKPANVKLTPEGRVKVLDFGLAKLLSSEPVTGNSMSSPTLTISATTAGMLLGTPAYMSPEQAKGGPADRSADIWAFGVLMYELLTGSPLYSGETASEVLASVMMLEPDFGNLPRSEERRVG